MRISVREFVAVVTVIAFAIGGLIVGRGLAMFASVVMFAILMGVLITAIVSRGVYRSFAVGFLTPIVFYVLLLYMAGSSEFDFYRGRLPTTQVVQKYFVEAVENSWSSSAYTRRAEHVMSVMPLWHLSLCVGFGYIGGRFALLMHRRGDTSG